MVLAVGVLVAGIFPVNYMYTKYMDMNDIFRNKSALYGGRELVQGLKGTKSW